MLSMSYTKKGPKLGIPHRSSREIEITQKETARNSRVEDVRILTVWSRLKGGMCVIEEPVRFEGRSLRFHGIIQWDKPSFEPQK